MLYLRGIFKSDRNNRKGNDNTPNHFPKLDMSEVERLCEEEVNIDRDSYYYLSIKIAEYAFQSMEDRDISRFLREVDNNDLAVFLKGVSGKGRRTIFNCFSKRLAIAIAEDMRFMGDIRDKDKALAAYKLIRTLVRLMDEGEINVDGDNDYLYMLHKIYEEDGKANRNGEYEQES